MNPRRVWVRRALLVGLVILAGQQLWRHGGNYVFANKFAVVEPGRLYRGAWQQPWPMRHIVRERKIKTIVALAHPGDHYLSIRERELAKELGIRWVHIPIVDDRQLAEGRSISDLLEKAADELADPANYPLYFHCHHGVNRASMAQIAYRTKHCGWTLERATQEIADSFGLNAVHHGPDYRYMTEFYNDRVLPARRAQTQADAATRR